MGLEGPLGSVEAVAQSRALAPAICVEIVAAAGPGLFLARLILIELGQTTTVSGSPFVVEVVVDALVVLARATSFTLALRVAYVAGLRRASQ